MVFNEAVFIHKDWSLITFEAQPMILESFLLRTGKNYRKFFLAIFFCSVSTFVQGQDIYLFKVYLKDQIVKVYRNGHFFKKLLCSTGIKTSSTPTGTFKTYAKKERDGKTIEGLEVFYFYKTRFHKKATFHGPLEGEHPIVKEREELFRARKPSSGGCVILRPEDAKWIYRLPLGLSVEVIDGSENDHE